MPPRSGLRTVPLPILLLLLLALVTHPRHHICVHAKQVAVPLVEEMRDVASELWTSGHLKHSVRAMHAVRRLRPYPCGGLGMSAGLAECYSRWHAAQLQKVPFEADILLYRPSAHGEGWGNRIIALTACYALAMLSGRVLLVDWTTRDWALEDFVTPSVEWDVRRLVRKNPSLAESLKNPHILDSASVAGTHLSPLLPSKFVVYSSYDAFLGALSRSPYYTRQLRSCKQTQLSAFSLLQCVLPKMISVTARVRSAIRATLQPTSYTTPFPVCVALRTGPRHTSNYVVTNAVGRRTMINCVLEQLRGLNSSQLEGASVFLSTDDPASLEEVKRRVLVPVVSANLGSVVHSGEQHGGTRTNKDVLRIFVDWCAELPNGAVVLSDQIMFRWTLANLCKDAILSDHSSFGYSAFSMAGRCAMARQERGVRAR